MKVIYDRNHKIAGIGLVPWTRLGPEKWFDQYKIASLYDWDVTAKNMPKVHSLLSIDSKITLPKLSTQLMLLNETFQEMLIREFKGYSMMTYKPVELPTKLLDSGVKFLSIKSHTADQFEDKIYFRNRMASKGVPFPTYRIISRRELESQGIELVHKVGKKVIVQDAMLSGGKGTFIVHDRNSLETALSELARLAPDSTEYVISELLDGVKERTLQGVVTRYGIFVGPLQKQIVRDETLANLDVADGDKFCGAEIGFEDTADSHYEDMKKLAKKIGTELANDGYRGIFGVDFLIANERVYVLETNARITGVTPLLTTIFQEGQIPFYLLHLLELMDVDYQLEDTEEVPAQPSGALLVIHAKNDVNAMVMEGLSSGEYDSKLHKISNTFDVHSMSKDHVVLERYIPPRFTIKPGGRIMYMYANRPVLGPDDVLLPEVAKIVQKVQNSTILEGKVS